MRRAAAWMLVATGLLAVLAGCAPEGAVHPAVSVIEDLLELRRADSRSAETYAPFFLESSLATALAEPSGDPTGTPRVPLWETPYVSEETSDTASVVVVWKQDPDFEGWPGVNVFSVQLLEGAWVVVDAVETTTAPPPLEVSR